MEDCDQKPWSLANTFGMIIPGSETYFLEVSAHVFLKVVSDDFFRHKETMKIEIFRLFFLKENGGVQPKNLK